MNVLRPLSYAQRSARWIHSPPPTEPIELDHLDVVTLNTWFEPAHREARTSALVRLLEHTDFDVACLQEVTPDLRARIEESPWARDELELVSTDSVDTSYGLLVLCRCPIRVAWELELPSLMNRSLLAVELHTSQGPLVVSTVHLESTRMLAASRVAQLEHVFEALDPHPRALLTGDFNFDPADPEEDALDPRYVDVWPALRPGEPGYTEDTTRNAMRLRHHGEEKHARYDRVLARLPAWRPARVELFADAPIGNAVFVSDHFGVRAVFEPRA